VDAVQDSVMEAEVLAYAVLSTNGQCETVWYLNARGEIREEALGLPDGWRQATAFDTVRKRSPTRSAISTWSRRKLIPSGWATASRESIKAPTIAGFRGGARRLLDLWGTYSEPGENAARPAMIVMPAIARWLFNVLGSRIGEDTWRE
jgi:uncharacterized protein YbdZ (MbtH family)